MSPQDILMCKYKINILDFLYGGGKTWNAANFCGLYKKM